MSSTGSDKSSPGSARDSLNDTAKSESHGGRTSSQRERSCGCDTEGTESVTGGGEHGPEDDEAISMKRGPNPFFYSSSSSPSPQESPRYVPRPSLYKNYHPFWPYHMSIDPLPGNASRAPSPGKAPSPGNDSRAPSPGNASRAPSPRNARRALWPGDDSRAPSPGNDTPAPSPARPPGSPFQSPARPPRSPYQPPARSPPGSQ